MQVLPLGSVHVLVVFSTLLIQCKQGQHRFNALHSWLMVGSMGFRSSREMYDGADALSDWILFTSRFELDEFQFENAHSQPLKVPTPQEIQSDAYAVTVRVRVTLNAK